MRDAREGDEAEVARRERDDLGQTRRLGAVFDRGQRVVVGGRVLREPAARSLPARRPARPRRVIVTFRCMTPSSPISPARTVRLRRLGDDLLERRCRSAGRTSRPGSARGPRGRRRGTAAARPRSRARSARTSGRGCAARRARPGRSMPGVVGDLVVAGEGRVDDGATGVDVADDRGHGEVALDDDHERPQQRVHEAAVPARPDVQPLLLVRVPELLHDVADHQDEGAHERRTGSRSTRGNRRRCARYGALVAAAWRSSATSAGRRPSTCSSGLRRRRAGALCPVESRFSIARTSFGAEDATARPSSLSHQRNAGMSSFEPSRSPVCAAPVCDDQSVSHLIEAVRARPASQRARFGAFRRGGHAGARRSRGRRSRGRRTPGISDSDRAGLPHLPLDDAPVEDLVVVDREDGGDDDGDEREPGCEEDALPDAVDVEALDRAPRRRARRMPRSSERAEPERQVGDREREADQERPDERVEQRRGRPPPRAQRPSPPSETPGRKARRRARAPIALITSVTSGAPGQVRLARRPGDVRTMGFGVALAHRASLNQRRAGFIPRRTCFTQVKCRGAGRVRVRAPSARARRSRSRPRSRVPSRAPRPCRRARTPRGTSCPRASPGSRPRRRRG